MAATGRRPRGNRRKTSLALPSDHLDRYEAAAAAAGIPLGDYIAINMAEHHGLPIPSYYKPKARSQQELPLGA